ncbi:hypothetical protein FB451DRAFT_1170946 [Mycena latifolia]|nr:hypothetical protein FB451DRAFT_1170946 [Mycena latifolia]
MTAMCFQIRSQTALGTTLMLAINRISYKPFINLFNLTEATKTNPEISGIELQLIGCSVRNSSSGEPMLRLKFKNEIEKPEFRAVKMFRKTDRLLLEFISRLTYGSGHHFMTSLGPNLAIATVTPAFIGKSTEFRAFDHGPHRWLCSAINSAVSPAVSWKSAKD